MNRCVLSGESHFLIFLLKQGHLFRFFYSLHCTHIVLGSVEKGSLWCELVSFQKKFMLTHFVLKKFYILRMEVNLDVNRISDLCMESTKCPETSVKTYI